MQNRSLEREAKLQAPPDFVLPDLNDVIDGAVATSMGDRELVTTYYDSSDLRLTRWGCSLRFREGEGWQLKLPRESEGAMLVRGEYAFGGRPRPIPTEALAAVTALLRGARVRAVAKLRTLRRGVMIKSSDGAPLATVTDDDVSVERRRGAADRFREIEVELAPTAPVQSARALVSRLAQAGASEANPIPKIVRALGPKAAEPPDVSVPSVHEDARAVDVLRQTLAASAARLLLHDPAIRIEFDAEATHQARVATRRVRSDLQTFRGLLNKRWADSLRADLRELGRAFGAVRDLDVFLERLGAATLKLPSDARAGAASVMQAFESDRAAARRALLDVMQAPRYVALLDRLVAAAGEPHALRLAERAAQALMPPLFGRQWKKAEKAAARAKRAPSDAALHEVRIRVKSCRYVAETMAPIGGKRAKAFADEASNLQDALGTYRDAIIAYGRLRAVARGGIDEAFAAGQLAMTQLRASRKARRTWQKRWGRLCAERKRLKAWQ